MLTFGSCITFVLSVDVSSFAKISADSVARWATLAAVEKELCNCWWKEQTFISGSACPEGMTDHHLLVMLRCL